MLLFVLLTETHYLDVPVSVAYCLSFSSCLMCQYFPTLKCLMKKYDGLRNN